MGSPPISPPLMMSASRWPMSPSSRARRVERIKFDGIPLLFKADPGSGGLATIQFPPHADGETMASYICERKCEDIASDAPVAQSKDLYYFEVTVRVKTLVTTLTFGFSTHFMGGQGLQRSAEIMSDGRLVIDECIALSVAGLSIGVGDVVGCGFDSRNGHVFFTRNGEMVFDDRDHWSTRLTHNVHVVVRSDGPATIQINLDGTAKPFMYHEIAISAIEPIIFSGSTLSSPLPATLTRDRAAIATSPEAYQLQHPLLPTEFTPEPNGTCFINFQNSLRQNPKTFICSQSCSDIASDAGVTHSNTMCYFEVFITAATAASSLSFGFTTRHQGQNSGTNTRSIELINDGKILIDGNLRQSVPLPVEDAVSLFWIGDIVGCGYDVQSCQAFFTLNGALVMGPDETTLVRGTEYHIMLKSTGPAKVLVNVDGSSRPFSFERANYSALEPIVNAGNNDSRPVVSARTAVQSTELRHQRRARSRPRHRGSPSTTQGPEHDEALPPYSELPPAYPE